MGWHAFSSSFGDVDSDGFLDLFVTRWSTKSETNQESGMHLWRNQNGVSFENIDKSFGLAGHTIVAESNAGGYTDWTLSASFSDINNDFL